MPARKDLFKTNLEAANNRFGTLSSAAHDSLKALIDQHQLSVAAGDLLLLDGRWYVTHAGLLRLSRRKRCRGIGVSPLPDLSDPAANRWKFKAVVYTSPTCKGFDGYGDADPSNVSALVRGAEMRIAETRAVNRALRKAYGIGLCSVEEIGNSSGPIEARNGIASQLQKHSNGNGDLPGDGQPLLRDRLCLLIRQHNLDAVQVKRYAAEFCHVQSLRDASRKQIEELINHLTNLAEQGGNTLLEQLEPHAEKSAEPTEAA
jgi:hypothetical protein